MLALWGCAVATAFVPGMYAAPFMPRWWAVMGGLAIVPAFDPRKLCEPFVWVFGVFLLWSGLTLLWTPGLFGGAFIFATLALFGAVAIASGSLDETRRTQILLGFACGMAVSCVMAAGQRFGIFNYFPVMALPAGSFFNSEPFAEATAPILVWAIVSRRWSLSAVLAMGLVVAREHAAIFAVAVALAYAAIRDWRWRTAAFLAVAIIGVLALMSRPESADTRILYWATAVRSLTVFGAGLGWWYQAHPFPFEEYAHSDVLQFGVESGIIALALPVCFFLALWKSPAALAERALFVACGVLALVSFPLHMPATLFLTAVAAGAVACRNADLRVAQLPGRSPDADAVRWQAAYGFRVFDRLRARGGAVSVRSALARLAHLHPQADRGTIGGAI